ncbi:MAG: alpha-1,2-fucosyltransferase, partial [candidate division WOR-3 bacterium]
ESLADTRDHILNCNAVAVHVRKLQYGNTIGPEYYIEAINRIRKKVLFPHFFIFSDSPTWWQENMPDMEDTNLIPNLQQAAIHDFHLMTLCKHFIVPDSTFSWWASQLARNDNKICIFPKNYARGARGILL